MKRSVTWFALLVALIASLAARADGVLEYGDEDLSNTGLYPTDPKTGAALLGLAPGVLNFGAPAVFHAFPFSPAGDYPGTDQIYVGAVQTAFHDGYSGFGGRTNGPQIIKLDYSSLVGPGQTITTFTLGVAADDFQNLPFGQPYAASLNGVADSALTAALNNLDQTGPVAQFLSIGVDPSVLLPTHELTLSIDQLGDGGDGWSVDFATIGVTTVPEPATAMLAAIAAAPLFRRRSSPRS